MSRGKLRVTDGRLVGGQWKGSPQAIAARLAKEVDTAPGGVAAWLGFGPCEACRRPALRLIHVDKTVAVLIERCDHCGTVGKWVRDAQRVDSRTWPWLLAAYPRWD